ncbi:MAG: hypothetical protein JJW01_01350 [Alphaproteobacteria bacterium]|nr:hypothetical protein [Rickettsiales bacterium]
MQKREQKLLYKYNGCCYVYSAFIAFSSFIFIFFGCVFAAETFDQSVIAGCTLKTLQNEDVVQICEGTDIPQVVFNNKSGGSAFPNAKRGAITGASMVGDGMVWVQNATQLDGRETLEICESKSTVLGVIEQCKRFNVGHNSITLSDGLSIEVAKLRLNLLSDSSSSYNGRTIKKGVHSNGYTFVLMGDDCPYESASNAVNGVCSVSSGIKSGFTRDNNCYLKKDYISMSCGLEIECPCDNSNYKCDNNFNPTGDNPFKDDENIKTCYQCFANVRKALKNCIAATAVDSSLLKAYNATNFLIRSKLTSSYGEGTYLCAFAIVGKKNAKRLGCSKFIPGLGPRPYPRIAKADDMMNLQMYPAAHLFLIYPFVKSFRDNDEKPSICSDGKAELGESERGTFFRPKIKILLSDTLRVITFNPDVRADMNVVYGSTKYNANGKMVSGWNENIPLRMESSELDKSTCTYINTGYNTYVCTRLEYDDSNGRSVYAAYHVPSLTGQTSVSETCLSLGSRNALVFLGSTDRPPLKYSLDNNGAPLLPVYIKLINPQDSDKRYPVSVTFDPKLVYSDIAGYHDDIPVVSVNLTPSRYEPLSETIVEGERCTMLFNYKICIEEDKCNALDYIDERVKNKADLSSCDTAFCRIYKSLYIPCERRTYCNRDYQTVAKCQQNFHYANLLKLDESFSGYTVQDQWTPSVCLTMDTVPILNADTQRLYGFYGDPGVEVGVEMVDQRTGRSGKLLKTFEMDNVLIHNNILPVHSSYFEKGELGGVVNQIKTTEYEYGDSVAVAHFGASCDDNCLQNSIRVRRRNMRELGGCINFNPASDASSLVESWDPISQSGTMSVNTTVTDIYIPLACRYLDLQFQGPGGGASSPSKGSTIAYQNDGYAVSSGSTGGHGTLVFDSMSQEGNDFLRIVRGNSGNNYGSTNAFGAVCRNWVISSGGYSIQNWDYNAIGILTATQEIAYAYGGVGNVDMGSVCGIYDRVWIPYGTATHNENYFFKGSYLNASDLFKKMGSFNGKSTIAGKQGTREYGMNNMFGNRNLFGYSGITNTKCRRKALGICWSRSWSITPGGPSGAIINPSRVRKNGSIITLDANSPRDPECISMCPRMNIKMMLKSKDVVCEYGASRVSNLGIPFDVKKYDNQVPAGGYGIPSYCTDKDGIVYISSSDMSIQKCPNGKVMYTGNDRLYSLCVDTNSQSNALKTILSSDATEMAGAGIYCNPQDKDCSATRYWDAKKSRGIVLESSLSSLSKFGRKCLAHGMWATKTGPNSNVPIQVLSKASYQVIKPYLYSRDVNPGDVTAGITTFQPNSLPISNISEKDPIIVRDDGIVPSDPADSGSGNLLDDLLAPGGDEMFNSFSADCPYVGGTPSNCPSGTLKDGVNIGNNCILFKESLIAEEGCQLEDKCLCNFDGIICDSDYLPITSSSRIPDTLRGDTKNTHISSNISFDKIDFLSAEANGSSMMTQYPWSVVTKDNVNKRFILALNDTIHTKAIDVFFFVPSYANQFWHVTVDNGRYRDDSSGLFTYVPPYGNDKGFVLNLLAEYGFKNAIIQSDNGLMIPQEKINCFNCLSRIRRVFDKCMNKANEAAMNPITNPSEGNVNSSIVPYGSARGLSINNFINQSFGTEIEFKCPAINPENVPFESMYSLNAIWPESVSGSQVGMLRCMAGFVPNVNASLMRRFCSFLGTWKGVSVSGDKPCLYTCEETEDSANAIRWESPVNYSNPISLPMCMPAKALIYVGGVQKVVEVATRLPNGVNPSTWARVCHMPAAQDPVKYSSVSQLNPMGKMPYWGAQPSGSKCVPTSFLGECRVDRNLCYDSANDGEDAVGYCSDETEYVVNSISTSPPTPTIQNGVPTDYNAKDVYIFANNITMECIFDKTTASSSDIRGYLPFSSFSTTVNPNTVLVCTTSVRKSFLASFPNDSDYGMFYEFSENNTPVRDLSAFSAQLALDLETKVKNDIAIKGENCLFPESNPDYDRLSSIMSAYALCSSVCFDVSTSRFVKYSCEDKIPESQNVSRCLQLCSTDEKEVYFSYELGITFNHIPAGYNIWNISSSNTSRCVGKAIPVAVNNLRSSDPSYSLRAGHYCDKVFFSVTGNIENGVLKLPASNAIFNGEFDVNKRGCTKPNNCTLPNGTVINHRDTIWIAVADSLSFTDDQYRFRNSVVDVGSVSPGYSMYDITGDNLFVIQIGCVDREFFLLDTTGSISYSTRTVPVVSPISIEQQVRYGLLASESKFSQRQIWNFSVFVNSMPIDSTTPMSYYLSMARLYKRNEGEQTGDILNDEFGRSKTFANPPPARSKQISDYMTIRNNAEMAAVFPNLDMGKLVNMHNDSYLHITLDELNILSEIYGFAIWKNIGSDVYNLEFIEENLEIFQRNSIGDIVQISIGDESFKNLNSILDFDQTNTNLGNVLRSRWVLMCSPRLRNCVIKSLLTGYYIDDAINNDTRVNVETDDISRAAKFVLSN